MSELFGTSNAATIPCTPSRPTDAVELPMLLELIVQDREVIRALADYPEGDERNQFALQALKIGPYLLLTIPGEPMVEYGLQVERAIGDRAIPIVIGYANGSLGYICTDKAFEEGGYEPNHSQSGPGAEKVIVRELLGLVDRVVADVFEAFRPATARGEK